jgi:ketosteroid isomerase-like protein
MHKEEKAAVEKAIIDRTSEWFEANRQRDADAVIGLFDDSDEMRHAENGVIFTYAALADFVGGWYDTTDEMDALLEEKHVFPLAPDAATMTGLFRFEAKQRSGEVWTGRRVFTFVFIKRGDAWKVIHGHESSVPSSQTE